MQPIIPLPDSPVSTDTGETETPPPHPAQLAQTRIMAGLGIRPMVISIFFSVSLPDLMKSCGAQIAAAAQDANKAILAGLKEMALSQRHPSATLFWVKTFCADLLPTPKNRWPESDPSDRIQFTVYNNDGEPNHDY